MKENSNIASYQISYRTEGKAGYTSHYFDLPLFSTRDYANAKLAADSTLAKLQQDFPSAEWRMVEVWE